MTEPNNADFPPPVMSADGTRPLTAREISLGMEDGNLLPASLISVEEMVRLAEGNDPAYDINIFKANQ